MKLPHLVHRDPHWRIIGVHRYYQCKCGARRVMRAYSNLMGPVDPGWPDLFDKHGQFLDDSGWVRMAETVNG